MQNAIYQISALGN